MMPCQPPFIARTTVERRTVLRWLGNATVLALGGDMLSACLGTSIADSQRPDAGGAGGAAEAEGARGFDFQPGPGTDPIFDSWYENTVDAQNLVDILAGWTLTVNGMVSKPLALGFADLIALARQDQVTDMNARLAHEVAAPRVAAQASRAARGVGRRRQHGRDSRRRHRGLQGCRR